MGKKKKINIFNILKFIFFLFIRIIFKIIKFYSFSSKIIKNGVFEKLEIKNNKFYVYFKIKENGKYKVLPFFIREWQYDYLNDLIHLNNKNKNFIIEYKIKRNQYIMEKDWYE